MASKAFKKFKKRWAENLAVQWKFHLAEVQISARIVQAGTTYQPLTYLVLYQSVSSENLHDLML